MDKSTHFIGQPTYGQLINLLDKYFCPLNTLTQRCLADRNNLRSIKKVGGVNKMSYLRYWK